MKKEDRLGAVTDHIIPPRDAAGEIDHKLMWDRKNWQVLCDHCHDVTKQRMELLAKKTGDMTVLRFWCESIDNWPRSIRIA